MKCIAFDLDLLKKETKYAVKLQRDTICRKCDWGISGRASEATELWLI